MQPELEIRFYPIVKNKIIEMLVNQQAVLLHPEIQMRRILYLVKDTNVSRWLRVRDEGSCTTVTLKENHNVYKIDGIHELELVVNSFKDACSLFKHLGFNKLSYQESLRETWTLDGAIITIDTWPHLKPLIEIEGPTKHHVYDAAIKLGFDPLDARMGTIKTLYMEECGFSSEEFEVMDLIF